MNYKNCTIEKIMPHGYYRTYCVDTFLKADTLHGIKKLITEHLKQLKHGSKNERKITNII